MTQALVFDEKKVRIEALLHASMTHVKNYCIVNKDAYYVVFIDRDTHLSDDIRLLENSIEIGNVSISERVITVSGIFDVEYYSTLEISDPVILDKVNQNLLHIYSGGSQDTVPYPMPYSKEHTIVENTFNKKSEITNLVVYSRQQIIDADEL